MQASAFNQILPSCKWTLQTTRPSHVSPALSNGVWISGSLFVTGLLSATQILIRQQAWKVMSKRDVSVSLDVLAFVTIAHI